MNGGKKILAQAEGRLTGVKKKHHVGREVPLFWPGLAIRRN